MAPLNKNVALKMQLQKVPHCIKALVLKQKYRFYLYEIMKKKECAAAKSKWIGDITSFYFVINTRTNKKEPIYSQIKKRAISKFQFIPIFSSKPYTVAFRPTDAGWNLRLSTTNFRTEQFSISKQT